MHHDHVKLTPAGIIGLANVIVVILQPYGEIKLWPKKFLLVEWVKAAMRSRKKCIDWVDAVSLLGNSATVVQTVLTILRKSLRA